jgi:hypothetical protein
MKPHVPSPWTSTTELRQACLERVSRHRGAAPVCRPPAREGGPTPPNDAFSTKLRRDSVPSTRGARETDGNWRGSHRRQCGAKRYFTANDMAAVAFARGEAPKVSIANFRGIESAASEITVHVARYPEQLEQMIVAKADTVRSRAGGYKREGANNRVFEGIPLRLVEDTRQKARYRWFNFAAGAVCPTTAAPARRRQPL